MKIKQLLTFFIFFSMISAVNASGFRDDADNLEDCGNFFIYSPTCPHCHEMLPFIQMLEANYSEFHVNYIDSTKNKEFVKELADKYNTSPTGVPRFYIDGKVFVGFNKKKGELEYNEVLKGYMGYRNQIFEAVIHSIGLNETECELPPIAPYKEYPQWNIFLILVIYLVAYPYLLPRLGKRNFMAGFATLFIILVFAFIAMTPEQYIREFAEKFPFPVFVFIIALADGFNPCAFTVLIILLSLLTHTKSKKKMALIGGVFVITSALMYFIFIMSLMMIGSWVFGEYGSIILKVLGIGVLAAGAINLKDYFFFKKGISLTLSSDQQKDITKKARNVVRNVDSASDKKTLIAAIFATATLAAFVNLVELGCTAILPAVYMASTFKSFGSIVGANHILYTAFYSLVYILPLLAILGNFIYYFKSDRITEDQGKILKLAGGLLMITFGIVMLLKPGLLMF